MQNRLPNHLRQALVSEDIPIEPPDVDVPCVEEGPSGEETPGPQGMTQRAGGDLRSMKYYPYGATRSTTGSMVTDKLFTGQQQEPAAISTLGLYDYGARFYSTLTGRFISADPVIAKPGDPQTLNRYAYVRNNPLRLVDPTGLAPNDCGDGTTPCPEPAPTPVPPVPTPPPGVNEAEWRAALQACAANLAACLKWSYTAKYGTNPYGLVIVMGAGQSLPGSMESFRGYGEEFLEQKMPSCAGQAAQCWEDFKTLAAVSPTAANDVFGIMLIESAPNLADAALDFVLSGLEFVSGGLLVTPDRGEGALRSVLENGPRDREHIVGVIGFSEGAGTVSKFFVEHPKYRRVPFFLVEPATVDPAYRGGALSLPNFAGSYPFGSGSGLGFLNHGTHEEQAGHVLYCLAHLGAGGCR